MRSLLSELSRINPPITPSLSKMYLLGFNEISQREQIIEFDAESASFR